MRVHGGWMPDGASELNKQDHLARWACTPFQKSGIAGKGGQGGVIERNNPSVALWDASFAGRILIQRTTARQIASFGLTCHIFRKTYSVVTDYFRCGPDKPPVHSRRPSVRIAHIACRASRKLILVSPNSRSLKVKGTSRNWQPSLLSLQSNSSR